MKRPVPQPLFVTLAAAVLSAPALLAAAPALDAEALFAREVLPLLQSRCIACHGQDRKQIAGGVDLTSRSGALRAAVPGSAAKSRLFRAVQRTDPHVRPMPPKETDRLSGAQVSALRRWIDGGAPWPSPARITELQRDASGVTVRTSGGLSPEWTNRRYKPADLWAYRPLRRPPVPQGAANPVDAFLARLLRSLGLEPAPAAERRTLLRRVTFDLTGLPPTPEEVDAFVKDPAPNAWEKVVDRLLASRHYGEQMARHWLDLVRYADSAGLSNDYDRGSAWRYRDYVVRSFNSDKPYDQFVREQLAGDEIDPENPELLVAAGFLRLGPWELTAMEVPKVARQRFLDEVTDAVGQVFLGHALQCARCHDHKFDPVPTRDYYRIQSVFATTQLAERPAPFLPSESQAGFEEKRYLDARGALFEADLKRIQGLESAARAKWEAEHPEKKGEKPPRHLFLSPADLGRERIARKGLERLRWEHDRYEPFALSVYSGPTPELRSVSAPLRLPKELAGEREVTHILTGGDPFTPGDAVGPGVLSAAGEAPITDGVSGRRRALAEWITSPANPLAARVMANRVWTWTMGTPLAGNPNNFGATGKKPTHPELLDWLAAELMARKWSFKQLQRLILTSEAYRRSSRHPAPDRLAARDPSRSSYAVFTPRRLDAEELRDAMLAASGELNPELGGVPVRPEINPEVGLQPRQIMGAFAPAWEPSPLPRQRHRRTLYALKLRGVRDPLLEVFNAPSPDRPCELRESSTIAPQAFTLFNSEATMLRALALARRALGAARTREEALTLAFRLTLSRPPSPDELRDTLAHWTAMTERHRKVALKKPERPVELVREAVEENTGEKFTYTEKLVSAPDFIPDPHPSDASPEERGLMEVCLVLFNTNELLYLD